MSSFKRWVGRLSVIALGAAVVLATMPTDADARRGGGGFGSRGAKTYQAPPTTNTAPNAAAPINKSITQPGTPTAGANQAMRPGTAATQQASRFGGLKGLLMGGLFAAALAGIFGMGALASIAGFLLQMLLIGGIIYLVFRLFRGGFGGAKPAMATAGASQNAYSGRNPADILNRSGSAGSGPVDEVKIGPADYDAFERMLGEVQMAYGRSNLDALEKLLTPEMLSYFAAELDDNAKKGLLNVVSDVKLEQGDLAEAWREEHVEYATVALRYTLIDATVETASGRVVEGSRTEPTELTEIWTFARPVRGTASQWELSAIQST
ncbi:Tim44 domain-containing protein [Hyphomicrobium sp. CS1BSMeth3]|uniref:Tim44 domain-containing protein n=1 Tax=Hyphomicrobium sp. CS1BSMeth3 TaxID=1892844 RepID=UPI000930463E|nr:Tim44 domain-containing protein [Hyphomicrobium sp. CS1BSMeth3]